MNHATLLHFSLQRELSEQQKIQLKRDQNVYIFEMLPGSEWDEIASVLDEFKSQFEKIRIDAIQKEADKNQEAKDA
jgi:hypothetical protein